jgi:cyclopropane-fatty-acyl-phospholipid synthase
MTTGDKKDSKNAFGFSWQRQVLSRILANIQFGSITVKTPEKQILKFSGPNQGPQADITLKTWRVLLKTIIGGHSNFFEAFRKGEWETSDLTALLLFGELNETSVDKVMKSSLWRRIIEQITHNAKRNSKKGSKKNIASHYDLGNEFYSCWLDEGMTYSSALFEDGNETLLEAQRQKYSRIADKIGLKAGERLLEIGCGWGGFAELAAREFKCHVTGLTLSQEQAKSCKDRMVTAGVSGNVDIRLEDYRDVRGQFDKIISIEMLEAVGEKYWPRYFESIRDRLVPGGKAAIQSITIEDDVFENYKRNPDFIQQFIFPGGMLPTASAIKSHISAVGLSLSDAYFFGKSYVKTLQLWDKEFNNNWAQIEPLGFDLNFKKTWSYYLNYCAAGFVSGRINVGQFLIEKS